MQGQAYELERTIEYENMVARIFRPVLTDEEKQKRLRNIKTATANLIIGVERNV